LTLEIFISEYSHGPIDFLAQNCERRCKCFSRRTGISRTSISPRVNLPDTGAPSPCALSGSVASVPQPPVKQRSRVLQAAGSGLSSSAMVKCGRAFEHNQSSGGWSPSQPEGHVLRIFEIVHLAVEPQEDILRHLSAAPIPQKMKARLNTID